MSASRLSVSRDTAVADLIAEWVDRLHAGEADAEAFIAAHPEHADTLRRLLPAVRVMADLSSSADADAALGPDELLGELGDYRIHRELGRGGMGVVYEAEQVSLRRRVALKVLPWAAAMDPKQLQRFKNEALAAASLKHDHIVSVYAVGCERGVHYYAMELIDGRSLADTIGEMRQGIRSGSTRSLVPQDATGATGASGASGHPAPTAPVAAQTTRKAGPDKAHYRRVAELIAQAADALEFAHSMGVVHRDIKPANLLLDATGKVYVSDFGLARFGPDAGLTASGDLLGTLRYMSPEQALAKHGLVDHRTDVYSLGATLYELLTLRPAVEGEDKQEVLRRIAFDEPVAPRKLDKAIPVELETVTLKALAKDPAERYATAGELADDLRRFRDGRAILVRRSSVPERLWRWSRRRPAEAALVVLALLSTFALLAGLLWHNARLKDAAVQAASQRDAADEERRWAGQAVDDMYVQVAEKWLANQPKLQPLQREFLEKAERYYRRAAERSANAPCELLRVGEQYGRLAAINRLLGQYGPAEEAGLKSVAALNTYLADCPGEWKVGRCLVSVYEQIAAIRLSTGRSVGAVEMNRLAVDSAARLALAMPGEPNLAAGLASARAGLGLALENTGHRREAEMEYRTCLQELDSLTADARRLESVRSALATVLGQLGANLGHAHRWSEAEPFVRRSVVEYERLVHDSPADVSHRRFWAMGTNALGFVLNRLNRAAEALAFLSQSATAYEGLARDYPDLPDLSSELAVIQSNKAGILAQQGKIADAEAAHRQAIAIAERLVRTHPSVPNYRFHLARFRNDLSRLLRDVGRGADAEALGREATEMQTKLAAEFPDIPIYKHSLAEGLDNYATTLSWNRQSAVAEATYVRALSVVDELLKVSPDHTGYRKTAGGICSNLASRIVFYPNRSGTDLSRAAELARRAVQLNPSLGVSWRILAVGELRTGRWAESLAAFDRVRAMKIGIVEDEFFRAMAEWQSGQTAQAIVTYAEAVQRADRDSATGKPTVRQSRAEAAKLMGIPLPDETVNVP